MHLIDMKFHWEYLSHFKLDLFLTYFKTGFARDFRKKEDKLGIIKRSESRKPKIFTKHFAKKQKLFALVTVKKNPQKAIYNKRSCSHRDKQTFILMICHQSFCLNKEIVLKSKLKLYPILRTKQKKGSSKKTKGLSWNYYHYI